MIESYRSRISILDGLDCAKQSRYIQDFGSGRVVGSTGQPPWYDLALQDQKKFLNGKVHILIFSLNH